MVNPLDLARAWKHVINRAIIDISTDSARVNQMSIRDVLSRGAVHERNNPTASRSGGITPGRPVNPTSLTPTTGGRRLIERTGKSGSSDDEQQA